MKQVFLITIALFLSFNSFSQIIKTENNFVILEENGKQTFVFGEIQESWITEEEIGFKTKVFHFTIIPESSIVRIGLDDEENNFAWISKIKKLGPYQLELKGRASNPYTAHRSYVFEIVP